MAHQLNMSLTGYLRIRDLLTPKHLAVSQNSRKQHIFKKDFLLESPSEIAQEHKIKQLRPISEIQTIMKHFDAKFHQHKVKSSFFAKPEETKEVRRGGHSIHGQQQYELEKKMSYLINLPVIKTIKRDAEKYRNNVNAEQIKQRQKRKARILESFNGYMVAELKGSTDLQKRKRMNTMN